MKTVGIVAEYNPFHFGHEYHIKKTREQIGEECAVVCAMSGDFVQRGEAAIYSKFARAEAAVRSGADLVVELPVPWALSSAEGFARGAVALLGAVGAEYLSFGSEAGDVAPLHALADILAAPETNDRIKERLASDATLSYAAARQLAVRDAAGDKAALLEQPNNILAVEYLKAISALSLDMTPMTVAREGAAHDGESAAGSRVRSAMDIRRALAQGADIASLVPPAAAAVYTREREQGRAQDRERMELAVLSRLRMLPEEAYAALPDAQHGVGARLYEAARREASLDAVLAAAKTKRYALSRIRRMCMCAAVGVTVGMSAGTPPYIRVLAATERGCALLRALDAKEGGLPVITKPASVKQFSAECTQVFAAGAYAHDLFALAFAAEQERKGGGDWRISPKIVNNP